MSPAHYILDACDPVAHKRTKDSQMMPIRILFTLHLTEGVEGWNPSQFHLVRRPRIALETLGTKDNCD